MNELKLQKQAELEAAFLEKHQEIITGLGGLSCGAGYEVQALCLYPGRDNKLAFLAQNAAGQAISVVYVAEVKYVVYVPGKKARTCTDLTEAMNLVVQTLATLFNRNLVEVVAGYEKHQKALNSLK